MQSMLMKVLVVFCIFSAAAILVAAPDVHAAQVQEIRVTHEIADIDGVQGRGKRNCLNEQTLNTPIGEITLQLAALGMDVPAQLIESRTMVLLKDCIEVFGAVVK